MSFLRRLFGRHGISHEPKEVLANAVPERPRVETPTGEQAIYSPSANGEPLRQTEIISQLIQVRQSLASIKGNVGPEIERIRHLFALILTQDCDLEQDFTIRFNDTGAVPSPEQLLPNVILCEVMTAADLTARTPKGSDIWRRVTGNKDERYHLLQACRHLRTPYVRGCQSSA